MFSGDKTRVKVESLNTGARYEIDVAQLATEVVELRAIGFRV